jgi:hypothetical protein
MAVLCQGAANQDSSDQGNQGGVLDASHPDYPGRDAISRKLWDVTGRSVRLGVTSYHAVFERWPATWQEVVDSGLWQSPVVGIGMEDVDPDDVSLDFYSDLYYEAPVVSGKAGRIHQLEGIDGLKISHHEIWIGEPLPKMLRNFEKSIGLDADKYLSDVRWLKFIALRNATRSSIGIFKSIHGRYPRDGNEFLRSGLGPIDFNSVNPLTGGAFYLDGRELDFHYKLSDDGSSFEFYHVEEVGKRATF